MVYSSLILDVLSPFLFSLPIVPPEIKELLKTGSLWFLSFDDKTESAGRWYDFYLVLFSEETENLTSSTLSFSLSLPLEIFTFFHLNLLVFIS